MCYSAQVRQKYQDYVRAWGADIDIEAFVQLYWQRQQDRSVHIPKGMDAAFAEPRTADERRIRDMIEAFDAAEIARIEQDLFAQRARLAEAERRLAGKPSKAAAESRRIATAKIARGLERLAELRRREPEERDARIYPGWHAPVMLVERGRRIVRPMRYQCRPAGKPADFDRRFPGTYNARRDKLEGFWREQFGHTHGVVMVRAFYEHVSRHAAEGRALADGEQEQSVVLEFRPDPPQDMLVACLWSRWTGAGHPDLLSFAAITDTPPPEVAAAGHDRCIVPLKAGNLDAWLNPEGTGTARLQHLLEDRERPWYAHRLVA